MCHKEPSGAGTTQEQGLTGRGLPLGIPQPGTPESHPPPTLRGHSQVPWEAIPQPTRVQSDWQLWEARHRGLGKQDGQRSQSPRSGKWPAGVSPKGAMTWLRGQSLRPTQLPGQPLQPAVGLSQLVQPTMPR